MLRVILSFLFFTAFAMAQNDADAISWNENRRLNWSDFKAKPIQNTNAAALTASGISFGYSIGKTGSRITKFKTEVKCLFYPHESWYKSHSADAHILGHEQLHFDITELHARKFRQQISKIKPSSHLKKQLNDLYKAISRASYDMQKTYDAETNHSINKERQAFWSRYISTELKRLQAFKSK